MKINRLNDIENKGFNTVKLKIKKWQNTINENSKEEQLSIKPKDIKNWFIVAGSSMGCLP